MQSEQFTNLIINKLIKFVNWERRIEEYYYILSQCLSFVSKYFISIVFMHLKLEYKACHRMVNCWHAF